MSKVSLQLDQSESWTPDGTPQERRRSARSQLIVRVDYMTIDEVFSEFTSDINEGGLFIETEKPCPAGTEVSMYFNLAGNEDAVHTVGRVVRLNSGEDGSTPGMGIEFDDLSDDARVRINALVRGLRAQPVSSKGDR